MTLRNRIVVVSALAVVGALTLAAPASAATTDQAPRSLSATARAAIDAMRRGVVAYSAVADSP